MGTEKFCVSDIFFFFFFGCTPFPLCQFSSLFSLTCLLPFQSDIPFRWSLNQLFFTPACHCGNVTYHGKKQTIFISQLIFTQKVYFWSKTGQMNITIEFSIFDLVCHQVCPKRVFRSKKENLSITLEFCIFEFTYVPNFTLNRQFPFLQQICPKGVFPVRSRTNEYYYIIKHIRLTLATNFNLKQF